MIFVSVSPLILINTSIILGGVFTQAMNFIYRKLSKSIWILFLVFMLSWIFGDILSLFIDEEVIVCTGYAFIGIFGGSLNSSLELR